MAARCAVAEDKLADADLAISLAGSRELPDDRPAPGRTAATAPRKIWREGGRRVPKSGGS